MLGSIAGDVIGSVYEKKNVKSKVFDLFSNGSHFTDDSVLTVAVADAIINEREYGKVILEYVQNYPNLNFGSFVKIWSMNDGKELGESWGNGSAMRVAPIGFAYNSMEKVLHEAEISSRCTHNHPQAIKASLATAAAVFLARTGKNKDEIKRFIENNFKYNLDERLNKLREYYKLDLSAEGTVVPALISFLESDSFEDAIRNAISLGGDSDTIACITGGIAEAYYKGVPKEIKDEVWKRLDENLQIRIELFYKKYF